MQLSDNLPPASGDYGRGSTQAPVEHRTYIDSLDVRFYAQARCLCGWRGPRRSFNVTIDKPSREQAFNAAEMLAHEDAETHEEENR